MANIDQKLHPQEQPPQHLHQKPRNPQSSNHQQGTSLITQGEELIKLKKILSEVKAINTTLKQK